MTSPPQDHASMTQISIFVRLQQPVARELFGMLDGLVAQAHPDWQLHCIVGDGDSREQDLARSLREMDVRVKVHERPADDLLAWDVNALLAKGVLGDWVLLLDQHDRLVPESLETLLAAGEADEAIKVVYAAQCLRDRWGKTSYINHKQPFDYIRLRSQEYLQSPSLIRVSALGDLAGFDRLASDVPTHDLYLRIQELYGDEAFAYVPEVLLQGYRDYLDPVPEDIRRRLHMVPYDLHAIRTHLARNGQEAEVRHDHGAPLIEYQRPAGNTGTRVLAVVVVGDSVVQGRARLMSFLDSSDPRRLTTHVLYRGENQNAIRTYRELAKGNRCQFSHLPLSSPLVPRLQALFQGEGQGHGVTFTHGLLLQGTPQEHYWLGHLIDHASLPWVGAVAGRVITPTRLAQPGTLNYRYQDWDWNTRGSFNHLTVPHQIGALGSTCLLFNLRIFRRLGGFNPEYPELYAMDYTLRVSAAGGALIQVPYSVTSVTEIVEPQAEEIALFLNRWGTWADKYQLHHAFL